jgi:oligo-1,6-glucosidase
MSTKSSYSQPKWWKEAVIYQIYPASFQDTNGDGWGDVKGITSRLDYLRSLGVDVVWTSPIYKSPRAEMGYDIADYKDIDPAYGSLGDVDELIAELKKRDMKLMMDLVVNHTSNMHEWFLESRSSKSNPKRDWYIWKPPKSVKDGIPEPPNNWAQILGEANSAWTYDEKTQEYYLSVFTPEQPDLNWENPEVRTAVYEVMDFWLKRGCAGYRMDVINMISKVPTYPEAPIVLYPATHKYQPGTQFFVNGPKLHDYLHEMHQEVLSKYDAITVGEMPGVSDEAEVLRTDGATARELNKIFIFDLVDIDKPNVRMALNPWDTKEMKSIVSRWQRCMIERDGWNSVFIENHDNPRSVSRYTDDSHEFRDKGAKLLALMQTTLGGSLFIYQGEEIGIRNAPRSWDISREYKDIETVNYWKKCQELYKDDPKKLGEGRKIIHMKARDHARTSMQWDPSSKNAGFCKAEVKPWMRVMDDVETINAQTQMSSNSAELSTWQFWQQRLKDRKKKSAVFVYGDYEEVPTDHAHIFAYLRTGTDGERWLVVLNFSGRDVDWNVPAQIEHWECSTYVKGQPSKIQSGVLNLKPWEGVLGKLRA